MLYAWNGMMPPVALILSFCPSPPTILGMLGPWMSMSATPSSCPRRATLTARFVVTVLLPTPPLLLMTRILLRMTDIRLFTSQRLCPSLSFWQVSFSSQIAYLRRERDLPEGQGRAQPLAREQADVGHPQQDPGHEQQGRGRQEHRHDEPGRERRAPGAGR